MKPELITAKLPTAWDQWEQNVNNCTGDLQRQAVFDFCARWRFAASLEGIQAVGYKSDGVVRAYHALLRLVVVCTASEQLATVLKKRDVWDLYLDDHDLAIAIREELYQSGKTRFARALRKGAGRRAVKNLERFGRGESSDVQQVALMIRNGVAHGTITPSGASISTPTRTGLILDLGSALLRDADHRFSESIETM